jgi:anthranilate phosphoribosyltransferase
MNKKQRTEYARYLVGLRWKKMTKEERKAYSEMMLEARRKAKQSREKLSTATPEKPLS